MGLAASRGVRAYRVDVGLPDPAAQGHGVDPEALPDPVDDWYNDRSDRSGPASDWGRHLDSVQGCALLGRPRSAQPRLITGMIDYRKRVSDLPLKRQSIAALNRPLSPQGQWTPAATFFFGL